MASIIDNIVGIVGLLTAIFAVFLYFRKPQEAMDKRQALADKELDSKATILAGKEMESKAALLAQQVESEKVLNEKKFAEMNAKIDLSIISLQQNIHDVDMKVNSLVTTSNTFHFEMSNRLTELATILRERLPPRHGDKHTNPLV